MSWKLIHRNGESFEAAFSLLNKNDITQLRKREGWSRGIDWSDYLRNDQDFTAYRLHIMGDDQTQGLIALAVRAGFVELGFVEKAPSNKTADKAFMNAGELLFAHACLSSLESNGDGYVLLQAKSKLKDYYIDHYGMEVVSLRRNLLAIPPVESRRLIELYWNQRS
ncbi:hypothetical protein [Cohnella fermenti]|uniref:GNAT family N-acetyltransferase n=1 Tax=Cohnella fermenti TaxID=2565925 RepID=A0A4V3WDU0_9BACL|nr:hypothetical protein [Cohnella fermenti]THF73606.1 hypothetical protein E6C55_28395 [Cohnella fermenti]